MTNSDLESKIKELQARLKAENESNSNDHLARSGGPNPFAGSRPGSGRSRPQILGDMGTPTRSRRFGVDLPGSNSNYNANQGTDPTEVERKINEIMKLTGIIRIDGKKYRSEISDLEHLGELGNGTCGHVVKMLHKESKAVIAVKQMRRSGDPEENKRITMDLEVVLKSHDCDYIVRCLGCFITSADVWICMELMATCFDKLLKKIAGPIPEDILGKVTFATVKALHYLKENHGVIHRDIKPSNILLDERGNVKLCDFGISGRLVDSKARSKNAGCAAYMAPERISPPDPVKPDYDIRADVWSLGITLVELATGQFPYPGCTSDFEVLSRVLVDDPPSLPKNHFSPELQDFVRCCLAKDYRQRPKYKKLLEHPFLQRYERKPVDVAAWFAQVTQSRSETANRRKHPVLLRSLSDKSKTSETSTSRHYFSKLKSEVKSRSITQQKTDCDGFRGVWNILKSPLFGRKKKSVDSQPKQQPTSEIPMYSTNSANVSPLVLPRFIHDYDQRSFGHRPYRSTSVSPTRRYGESNFEEILKSEVKTLRLGPRNNPSPSPEPPPRINKMVSPLLMRRIAYNNLPCSEIPSNALFSHSSCLPRRFATGIPPQPPPRRKSNESNSVPCSPVPYHRVPLSPQTLWHQCDMFNRTQ